MVAQKVVLLRNSERATYRRCRLKWEWSYNRKLTPPRDKGALVFGTDVHYCLELYYPPGRKRGPAPAVTFAKLFKEKAASYDQWDDEGNRIDALELGVTILEEYVKEYGKDDFIEIVQSEQVILIEVFDRQGNYICTWTGKLDAVYKNLALSSRSNPVFGVIDHKTGKTIDETVRVNSGYGEQGLSYFWAADMWLHTQGFLNPDQHLDHVLFNFLKKALPDQRYINDAGHALNQPKKDVLVDACRAAGIQTNKLLVPELIAALEAKGHNPYELGEISKRQPKPLLVRYPMDVSVTNLASINSRIRAEAWEMAQVRAGKLPVIKNPTKDCGWECPFVEACELHEMGSDFEDMLRFEFTSWDPYEYSNLVEEKV